MTPTNKCLFKVGLYNAQSLNTCGDDFILAVDSFAPDLLAINESWLREGCDALAPVIPSYKFKMLPRPQDVRGGRGGGLAYYIRKGVKTRTLRHPVSVVEQWWLKINVNGLKIAVGTAYRPPWQSIDLFLDALTESVTLFGNHDKIVLLGDFNINQTDTRSPAFHKFNSFLQSVNLSQIVNVPTHFTDNSATIIDVVCTDVAVKCIEACHVSGINGHLMVKVTFHIKKQKFLPKFITYRPIKNITLESFNKELVACNFSAILNLSSVSDTVEAFNQCIVDLFDRFAPLRTSYIKQKPLPWVTDNIRFMINLKDNAFERYRSTNLESHKSYYKSLKSQVQSAIFCEKRAYFNYNINNHCKDPKTLWKNLKGKVLTDYKTEQLPSHFNNPEEINDNFLTIPGTGDDVPVTEIMYFKSHRYGNAVFSLKPVDEIAVGRAILSIDSNAQGFDDISMDMILLTLPHTLPHITAIINRSIVTSTFPFPWKTAVVTPIPKINPPLNLSDLRPISLLPFLSKVLERIVYAHLVDFLEKNNILPYFQSGFRRGVSTSTALLDVVDNVLTAQENGMATILVLLDYSRAFDSLSIPLLLSKLTFYGFDAETLLWFTSYLNERSQMVRIRLRNGDTTCSGKKPVNRGVPQGSILGPILFILYTADIVKSINHSRYHLYADDAQIYVHVDSRNVAPSLDKLNSDLNRIALWSAKNALVLNPNKSKYMVLGSKKQVCNILAQDPSVNILGSQVQFVNQAKNLGIIMDSHLRFEDHIVGIARNCLFRLKVLYKLRRFLSEDVRLNLCESLVLSKLNYGDVVTGPCLLSTSKRLIQRVQNACFRFCYSVPPRTHISPYLNSKSLLNMQSRRNLHFSGLVHTVIKMKFPKYLYDKLEWASCTYNSRRAHKPILVTPFHRTRAFEGSFRFQASKCWNDLPPPLQRPLSKLTFKNNLKKVLLEKQILA